MKPLRFVTGAILGSTLITACGPDEKVAIGEPGEKGIVRTSLDRADAVRHKSIDSLRDGEQTAYGTSDE